MPDNSNDTLQVLLSRRSRELGKTMTDIAADAGMARSYLYQLASGKKRDPSVRTLLSLATALAISPLLLFRFFAELQGTASFAATALPTNRAIGLRDTNDIAVFNADVTTPDHAVLAPGETFQKVWEFQNLGSIPWRGRKLVRVDGEYVVAKKLPGGGLQPVLDAHLTSLHQEVEVPTTMPGQPVRLGVVFAAPKETCTVASVWRLEDGNGHPCYDAAFICHVVITVMAIDRP
jgi:transcriptional regulator with XRE-family HTH domain